MDPNIEFVYDGKHYTVEAKAYNLNRITSMPPNEIATQMNGVVAKLNE